MLISSSSAYESQVTIKTLVQSETIGKMKIPSFLCKSSLDKILKWGVLSFPTFQILRAGSGYGLTFQLFTLGCHYNIY